MLHDATVDPKTVGLLISKKVTMIKIFSPKIVTLSNTSPPNLIT